MDAVGSLDGDLSGEKAANLANFYSYWSNYLEPTPAFLSFLAHIPGGLAKALYQITASLEHVFNNMFKLFGLFGYLGDQKTVIGQFFYWFQLLGTTLFTLILVVSAITGVFTKPVKYKNVIVNFLLVTGVTTVLPLALTSISTAIAQDAQTVQTISSEQPEETKHYSSLAIQPMKNNVVDLKILVDNDFSTELFPMDNYGYIKPVQKGSKAVNNITDNQEKRDTTNFATRIDFAATYGATNSVVIEDMQKNYEKTYKYKGIKGLFLHKLDANQTSVETITEHRFAKGLNAFEPVYMRYKVNWLAMFAQYLILIVLLISMSIKFVKSVFDIIIQAMISPIQGYSSLSNSKKYKELLRTIVGALAGIFFEVIIMRVTLEICRDLPTLSVSAITKLSGGFFDGLNMWEQCIAACIVYIGIFFAAMQGVSMIERWLGVSTGHNETAQQLLGAMMMGNAFATGAGAIGHGAMAMGGFGMDLAKKTPGAMANGSKIIGDSLAATGGGIRGAWNSVKDQGAMNAVKGGLSNMINLAEGKAGEVYGQAKDFVSGMTDNLGKKEQSAHDAVYKGLKNDAVPLQPGFTSPLNPNADYRLNSSGNDALIAPVSSNSNEVSEDGGATRENPLIEGGISDPTLPTTTASTGKQFSGISEPQTKPKASFQQSMSQMQYMNRQMQQAGQHMQGQGHIKGAEIDESEE